MTEVLLSTLIEKAREALQSFGYRQSTLKYYNRAWRRLEGYFLKHGQETFSEQLVAQYISEQKRQLDRGQISMQKNRFTRRAVGMLNEYHSQGYITWKLPKKSDTTQLTKHFFIQLHEAYISQLLKEHKSPATVHKYGAYSKRFLQYLELKGYKNILEAGLDEIKSFIPYVSKKHKLSGMHGELTALRSILRFAYLEKMSTVDLSSAVPGSCATKTSILPVLNQDEEKKLLQGADRATATGKRNFAILLLALRMGLRSIDIINLKLSDIKWRTNTIEIIQKKTGRPIILPLLAEVGNAIADYIMGTRPKSDCKYLFLRIRAPYMQLSDSATYNISSKIIKDAGIFKTESEPKGLHRLRRTMATRLLENETSISIISTILGHKNKDSTKVYLSADQKHLRVCALGLAGIEVTRKELL
ncbi:MAG: site-specific integrase [Candidatus Humimicrobiaceae bacterium]